MTEKLNVLITGVGGRSVGHQILHALLMHKDKYNIVCVDGDAYAFGLYSVNDRYVVPFASSPDYVPAIREIVRKHKISAILPGTEAEIKVLVPYKKEFEGEGCKIIASDAETIDLCQDKAALYRWLEENNIGVPLSGGVDDVNELIARCGFPLVAKPSGGSGGSRNVEILADKTEVEDYIARFPYDKETIVFQEYVGDAESEYTVGVIATEDGAVIDSIVMHRKLTGLSLGIQRVIDGKKYALSTGYSQGYIVKHPQIQEFCEDLIQKLNIRGPMNVQLRLHEGQVKVFEIHPRFSGTTSIRADAGLNEPDLAIRSFVLGERPGRQNYRSNVAAIRAFQTMIVPMDEMDAVTSPLSGL